MIVSVVSTYDPQQAGQVLESNSTLVCEIELLDVIRAEASEQEQGEE